MGSFEFGVYVYVWTWVLLLGGLVDLGIATGAQRFIPEYTGTSRLDMLRGFLSGSRWLVVAMATAWAALAALGVWLFCAHLDSYEIMPLYIACAGLPLFVLGRLQDGIARSYDWINLALMPPYVIRSLLLILAMGAAWWLKLPTDAATAMLAAVATTWVTVIGQTLVMNRRLAKKVEPGPRSYAAGAWLAASLPIFMVEGFYLLLTHADVLLLRHVSRARRGRGLLRGGEDARAGRVRVVLGLGRDRAQVLRISRRRQQGASSPRSCPTRSSGRSGPRSPRPS